MVLFGNKMMNKAFSFIVIYLIISSSIAIDIKAQEPIDWNDPKKIEEALKKDPVSAINQNPQMALEFIRNNPDLVLKNENIAKAYFDTVGVLTDLRDKTLAEKYLKTQTSKTFYLSQGKLQISDGNIIDERGVKFVIKEILAMADVIGVKSLNGGGLQFLFKQKLKVDIIEAKNIQQNNNNLIVDGKGISLTWGEQELSITSTSKKLVINCQLENCNFERNSLKVTLNNGRYEEVDNLIKTEKAIVNSRNDKLYGNAEFYYNEQGIDKTKPISLIGETSSAFIDGQLHRATPKNLPLGPSFKDKVLDSMSKNKELLDGILDPKRNAITKICTQCDVSLKESFDKDLASGKISGYAFGLNNPISGKQVMLNKGEVISKYDDSLVIGAHKSSEYRININENNIIIDGPHSKEKNAYLGSVIANNGRIDHFNENGKTVSKQDRLYKFGNVATTRFFFPEAVDENIRRLIPYNNFLKASEYNSGSSSGLIAVNRLFGGSNVGLIQDQKIKKAYSDLAQLLQEEKENKQVANLNDAFIKDQRVTNLYLLKAGGDVKMSQSGENHELFKVIAKEQAYDMYLSALAKNPQLANYPQIISQLQRLVEFMAWKNTEVHQAAARYEKLTNVWGYIPLTEFNPYLRTKAFFSSEDENLFNKIVENDRAQEGSQAILSEMRKGLTLRQIRDLVPLGSDTKMELVFDDPGINARLEIEKLAQDIKDSKKFSQEKLMILRETSETYKEQNEPEQALIFQAEAVKEDFAVKYGNQAEGIYQRLFNQRGELCDPRNGCNGLFQIIDTGKIRTGQLQSIQNRLRLGTYEYTYPKDWSKELVADVENLFEINQKIQEDKTRKQAREFVESFFDAEQLAIGFGISAGTGGVLKIISKFGSLIKSTPSLAKKGLYAAEAGAFLTEDTVVGISSALVDKLSIKVVKTYSAEDIGKLFEKRGLNLDLIGQNYEQKIVERLNQNKITISELEDYIEKTKDVEITKRHSLMYGLSLGSFNTDDVAKLRRIEGFDSLDLGHTNDILEAFNKGNVKLDEVPNLLKILEGISDKVDTRQATAILTRGNLKVNEIPEYLKSVDGLPIQSRFVLDESLNEGFIDINGFRDYAEFLKENPLLAYSSREVAEKLVASVYKIEDFTKIKGVDGFSNLNSHAQSNLVQMHSKGDLTLNDLTSFVESMNGVDNVAVNRLTEALYTRHINLDDVQIYRKIVDELGYENQIRIASDLAKGIYEINDLKIVLEIEGVKELSLTSALLAGGVKKGVISIDDIPTFVEVVKGSSNTYNIADGLLQRRYGIEDLKGLLETKGVEFLNPSSIPDFAEGVARGSIDLNVLEKILEFEQVRNLRTSHQSSSYIRTISEILSSKTSRTTITVSDVPKLLESIKDFDYSNINRFLNELDEGNIDISVINNFGYIKRQLSTSQQDVLYFDDILEIAKKLENRQDSARLIKEKIISKLQDKFPSLPAGFLGTIDTRIIYSTDNELLDLLAEASKGRENYMSFVKNLDPEAYKNLENNGLNLDIYHGTSTIQHQSFHIDESGLNVLVDENYIAELKKSSSNAILSDIEELLISNQNSLLKTPSGLLRNIVKTIKSDGINIAEDSLEEVAKVLSQNPEELSRVGSKLGKWIQDSSIIQGKENLVRGVLGDIEAHTKVLSGIEKGRAFSLSGEKLEEFSFRVNDKYLPNVITIGNDGGCCIAMGGANEKFAKNFFLDPDVSFIEIMKEKDRIGFALVLASKDSNGLPVLGINSIEIPKSVSGGIREKLVDETVNYLREFAEKSGFRYLVFSESFKPNQVLKRYSTGEKVTVTKINPAELSLYRAEYYTNLFNNQQGQLTTDNALIIKLK